jgi:hypothetical protein
VAVSEELLADVRRAIEQKLQDLGSPGWEFEVVGVSSRRPDAAVSVEFRHPLTPYTFEKSIAHPQAESAAARVAEWMDQQEEFGLAALASGAVRDDSMRLLQRLRGALIHTSLTRAVESVGWALFEHGILTRQEMDWLAHSFEGEWALERERASQARRTG